MVPGVSGFIDSAILENLLKLGQEVVGLLNLFDGKRENLEDEDPMYLEYYGFSDKPFALTPDLKFLYLTKGHKDVLSAVWRGVEERKGLMVLTGEVGTGKTM